MQFLKENIEPNSENTSLRAPSSEILQRGFEGF